VREGPRAAGRDGGMTGAGIDKNIAAGIGGNAADFTEVNSGGKLQGVGRGVESNLGRILLGGGRQGRNQSRQHRGWHQDLHRAPPLEAWAVLRINFCTRQDSISPTTISLGLRQSIMCTT